MLRGCSVIEGSLQINMVFINPSADFRQNITFPELRGDYLIIIIQLFQHLFSHLKDNYLLLYITIL